MDNKSNLGVNVAKRIELGLTQENAAERIGLSRQDIEALEKENQMLKETVQNKERNISGSSEEWVDRA